MSEPPLTEIREAVEREGGDIDDMLDLVDVWTRLHTVSGPKVDAMRRMAAETRCRCEKPSELSSDGRCLICFGRPRAVSR